MAALPYSLAVLDGAPLARVALHDPSDAAATGPSVVARPARKVPRGLLQGWAADAAAALARAPPPPEAWSYAWGPAEAHFERAVAAGPAGAATPEEVEALLPARWVGYSLTSADGDEALARVCRLCTALVDRCVALSRGAAPATAAGWRAQQRLERRLAAVMELLEASIGEDIVVASLGSPGFVRQCWSRLSDADRAYMAEALDDDEAGDAAAY